MFRRFNLEMMSDPTMKDVQNYSDSLKSPFDMTPPG